MNKQQRGDTGVKLVQRLLVDIMGALIPGIMFWVSVLLGGVCPFLFLTDIHIASLTSIDRIGGGWFWIVIFGFFK